MSKKHDPGKEIRKLMVDAELNILELAEKSKVSRWTISNIIHGKVRRPTRDTMELIADALGVKINKIWPDV
jgi:transcriptional regulator with XRE-family HTH domain